MNQNHRCSSIHRYLANLSFLLSVLLCCLPASAAQQPAITKITVLPDKQVQLDLSVEQGQSYIFEISTDLTNWTEVGGMGDVPTNRLTVVDETTTDRNGPRFYRMKVGRFQRFGFQLMHFCESGHFSEQALTPDVSYPLAFSGFTALFDVEGDAPYPGADSVLFTGPAGSGLNATPGDVNNSDSDESGARFQSLMRTASAGAPAGTWTVNYRGTNINFVTDLIPLSRLISIVPTITLSAGTLRSVSWVYRDRITGQVLGTAPDFMENVQLQVEGQNGRIYDSPDNLSPSSNMHTLTSLISWADVQMVNMAYDDVQGHHYVLFFPRNGN